MVGSPPVGVEAGRGGGDAVVMEKGLWLLLGRHEGGVGAISCIARVCVRAPMTSIKVDHPPE